MTFVNEKGYTLDIDISGYEFEYKENGEHWDNNWLIITIKYDDLDYVDKYSRACVLSMELADFVEKLTKLKNQEIEHCFLDTIEPYLKIDCTKNKNEYIFHIKYICNSATKEKIDFTHIANENEFEYFYNEFIKLSKKFKER